MVLRRFNQGSAVGLLEVFSQLRMFFIGFNQGFDMVPKRYQQGSVLGLPGLFK